MEQVVARRTVLAGTSALLFGGCSVSPPRSTPAGDGPSPASPGASPGASPAGPTPSASPTVAPSATASPTPTASATPSPTPSSTKPAKDTRSGAELDQPYAVNGIVVVSRKHPISKRYEPRNPSKHGLEKEVAAALADLTAAAKADGVTVKVYSAYRSYAEQDKLLKDKIVEYGNEKLARRYNAEPGKSEHQTGLAVDLWDGVTWGLAVRRTKVGKWLWKHAREYGFILRYPPGKEKITGYAYEPWHFRHIGVEHSMKFKPNSKVTLEEYLGLA
ncbi:MAG: D-alanyl-D-alanine carboxypeptidase family protein [Propionibacteriaceae bacterium]|nr:D-alanyl-D-alanine carboxypeptidase family protein [Propionibacteriaceae bacterium]